MAIRRTKFITSRKQWEIYRQTDVALKKELVFQDTLLNLFSFSLDVAALRLGVLESKVNYHMTGVTLRDRGLESYLLYSKRKD